MQASTVKISLFDREIATLFERGGRVYIEQIDSGAHFASPLSIGKENRAFETTGIPGFDTVPGFIHDTLPGNYGNEIMDTFFKKTRGNVPGVAERLLFIGDRALGAVTYSPATYDGAEEYYAGLRDLYRQGKEIREGRAAALHEHLVAAAHSIAGGARAKAVVGINLKSKEIFIGHRHGELPDGFMHAIVKYDDSPQQRHSVYTRLEYIYSKLARKAGISMAKTHLLESEGLLHFVTERFDRKDGKRLHMHSLGGLLHTDYRIPRLLDYDDLLRVALRLGAGRDRKQLFTQMMFNYMFVNQDDHAKNFSFLMNEKGAWRASPAYDITFAKGAKQTVEHQMLCNGKPMSEARLDDVASLAVRHGIHTSDIKETLETLAELRERELPALMKEYVIIGDKYDDVMKAVTARTLKGVL